MDKLTKQPQIIKEESAWSTLEQALRDSARKMLKLNLENEAGEFDAKHSTLADEN